MKKPLMICLFILLLIMTTVPFPAYAEGRSHDELNNYIKTEFDKTRIPGMSVQIVDAENILFSETYGNCTSLDSGFIIGSISKSFTAVCIMQLVEQGKIRLSDPIANYLPEVKPGSLTTVLQLLNQTSGNSTYSTVENFTTSDMPTEFEYANVNYALLGKIIENVSGLPYSSYIQTQIFDPLNMDHSFTSLKQAKASGIMAGYRNYFGLMIEDEYTYPDNNHTGWITIPAGYIISGTNDMGRYLQMYLNNGGNILTPDSVNAMISDSVEVLGNYQYGMGLGLDYQSGEKIITHGGNVQNYTCHMMIIPHQEIGIIVMSNMCDYFVANEMIIQLTNNIVNQYLGIETNNISDTEYWSVHLLIDALLMIVLIVSVFPLVRIKKWFKKNAGGIKKLSVVGFVFLHVVLPTLILFICPIMGEPLFVIEGFVPDIFIVIHVSSVLLYLTGIMKLIFIIRKMTSQRTPH